MNIILNGVPAEVNVKTAFALRKSDEVVVLNGFQISADCGIKENDEIVIIKKGVMPEKHQLEAMMAARHTPGVHAKMKAGKVAVAGLGGLGSHVAVMLTRMGVGQLFLVDFDVVEPSNLNRQHYNIGHLGQLKTAALETQLHDINPFIDINFKNVYITEENAAEIFKDFDIIVEAFDNPVSKANLTNALLSLEKPPKIVAASGLAGYSSANDIKTRRSFSNLYVVGDLESAAGDGVGLMPPRVSVSAGHQANMVVRLLLGLEEV